MEQLTLKMQQETKVRSRYEWGLKRKKMAYPKVVGQKTTTSSEDMDEV
jgi:hypothetical protein